LAFVKYRHFPSFLQNPFHHLLLLVSAPHIFSRQKHPSNTTSGATPPETLARERCHRSSFIRKFVVALARHPADLQSQINTLSMCNRAACARVSRRLSRQGRGFSQCSVNTSQSVLSESEVLCVVEMVLNPPFCSASDFLQPAPSGEASYVLWELNSLKHRIVSTRQVYTAQRKGVSGACG